MDFKDMVGIKFGRLLVIKKDKPDNCRWTINKVQQNNRRNTRYISFGEATHTIHEWSEITGIKYVTL